MSEITAAAGDQLRTVPLTAIVVRQHSNPRTFDEAAIRRMAATISDVGRLQQLLVQPAEIPAA